MHKCMKCGKIYGDDATNLLKGCECGSNLFVFERSTKEKKDIVIKEIDRFLNSLKRKSRIRTKVHFDLENIKIIKEGIYELNIRKFFEKTPIVVEIRDGSYHIHLPSAFERGKYESFEIEEAEKELVDTPKKLKK